MTTNILGEVNSCNRFWWPKGHDTNMIEHNRTCSSDSCGFFGYTCKGNKDLGFLDPFTTCVVEDVPQKAQVLRHVFTLGRFPNLSRGV